MRVISGYLKGRVIKGYNIEGTRPTMDRVKESVFSMINNNIQDSIILDLFCGSGSLGIEAISNNAKYIYFVDNNKIILNILKDNLINLNILDKAKIINKDYLLSLKYFKDNNIKFDIIFLDPPYKNMNIENILKYIDEYKLLNLNGIVVCEYSYDKLEKKYGNLSLIKNKKYGSTYINIYEKM